MFCPFCGGQNRDDKKFCRQCGRTLPPPRARGGMPDRPVLSPLYEPASIPEQNYQLRDQPSNSEQSQSSAKAVLPVEAVEDQLEPTGQLLPDTVGFQVPNALLPVSVNGSEKPTNGAVKGVVESVPTPDSPLTDFEVSSGEFMSTDELEMDKTLDKTVETPVLTSADIESIENKTARTSLSSTPTSSLNTVGVDRGKVARPLFSLISSSEPGQNVHLDRSLKIERIALIISIITMLAGLAILLWLLVLKPRENAHYYGVPGVNESVLQSNLRVIAVSASRLESMR